MHFPQSFDQSWPSSRVLAHAEHWQPDQSCRPKRHLRFIRMFSKVSAVANDLKTSSAGIILPAKRELKHLVRALEGGQLVLEHRCDLDISILAAKFLLSQVGWVRALIMQAFSSVPPGGRLSGCYR